MNWESLIQNVAFPILCVIGLAWFIYYIAVRWMNESKEREERQRKESKEREDRLIEANKEFSQALQKVAGTIETTNELNRVLSETNRNFTDRLDNIDDDLTKIINKLEILQETT